MRRSDDAGVQLIAAGVADDRQRLARRVVEGPAGAALGEVVIDLAAQALDQLPVDQVGQLAPDRLAAVHEALPTHWTGEGGERIQAGYRLSRATGAHELPGARSPRRGRLSAVSPDPRDLRLPAELLPRPDPSRGSDRAPDELHRLGHGQGGRPQAAAEGVHLPGHLGREHEHLLRHRALRDRPDARHPRPRTREDRASTTTRPTSPSTTRPS